MPDASEWNISLDVTGAGGDSADVAEIRRQLAAFNVDATGGADFRPLSLLLHDDQGKLRGGLLGWTVWSWLHIDSLWVEDAARGQCWR